MLQVGPIVTPETLFELGKGPVDYASCQILKLDLLVSEKMIFKDFFLYCFVKLVNLGTLFEHTW